MALIEITAAQIEAIKANRGNSAKTRKVSDEQVRMIRLLDREGLKNGEIAKLVALPPQYVSHIRRQKSYKDVQGEASLAEATAFLNGSNDSDEAVEQGAADEEPATFFVVD